MSSGIGNPRRSILPGSRVTLHFSLSDAEGNETVSTFGEEPATITLGDGSLSEGLELALYGLTEGAAQTLQLSPEQAFGHREESRVQTLLRSEFPEGIDPEPGLLIAFETNSGEELAGLVLEVEEQQVSVDFNHPLAGQEVIFRVKILDIA